MADDRFGRLPRDSRRVLQEFCDRENFSEDSDIFELTDDEDSDPTFTLPPPRICENELEEPDLPEEPEVPNEPDRRPQTAATPPARQPADNIGTWTVKKVFEPLPPAPWYELEDNQLDYVSTIDNFQRYIPDQILEDIAKATSANILSERGIEMPLNAIDIIKFIGITIKMSFLKLPRIKMYWAARTRVNDIADAMARNKYFLIRSNFRVRDYLEVTNEEKKHKYWKVAPLLNSIRNACLDNPRSQQVSIDEQMVPFWGSTQMRQRVKGKPNPVGLKNFVACAPDGLPLDFFLYEGKGDSILPDDDLHYPSLDIPGKVIVRLSRTLRQGSSVFMDRYFNSILLLDELHLLGFQGTGTLKKDRIPSTAPLYSDAEVRRGGRGFINQVVRDDGQIAIVKWFDNKPVVLASSVHGSEPEDKCKRWSKVERRYIEIQRPIVVKHYNDQMMT